MRKGVHEMKRKECVFYGMVSGLHLLLYVWGMMSLFMSYIHLEYLQDVWFHGRLDSVNGIEDLETGHCTLYKGLSFDVNLP